MNRSLSDWTLDVLMITFTAVLVVLTLIGIVVLRELWRNR